MTSSAQNLPHHQMLCPKCSDEGRPKMTRYHVVWEDYKLYLECERKAECGWRIQIVTVSMVAPDAPLPVV